MLDAPGLYVHMPWCVRKCPYCDFNSHPITPTHTNHSAAEPDFDGYADALINDWQQQRKVHALGDIKFASVFFGGGTPSLFQPHHFARLIEHLPLVPDAEVTMETNPGTAEYAPFDEYRDAGVNRFSIGAQSFNDNHLERLGRIHKAEETYRCIERLKSAGCKNFNVDLMWGLPDQSTDEALADLSAAISLDPAHLSWYQLTLEPKTEFAKRPPILPTEPVLADIEREGLDLLSTGGFQRYEVSAYAKADKECLHNKNYWRFGDYIGLGAGAHGKVTTLGAAELEITRTQKPSQPRLYLADATTTQVSRVAAEDRAFEFLLNGLRLIDGTSWETFEAHTGLTRDALSPVWEDLVKQELVVPERCCTTPQGYRYLDSVVGAFLP